MKARMKSVSSFEVSAPDGKVIDVFTVVSEWEGLRKLTSSKGETMIVGPKGGGFFALVFDEILGGKTSEVDVLAATPSLCLTLGIGGQSPAARDVLAERDRQISAEGWTAEHDDEHDRGELAQAAACYALGPTVSGTDFSIWPWDASWWKPRDNRRNLVKAGALILAEIERVDRAAIAAAEDPRSPT